MTSELNAWMRGLSLARIFDLSTYGNQLAGFARAQKIAKTGTGLRTLPTDLLYKTRPLYLQASTS